MVLNLFSSGILHENYYRNILHRYWYFCLSCILKIWLGLDFQKSKSIFSTEYEVNQNINADVSPVNEFLSLKKLVIILGDWGLNIFLLKILFN